jgi:hypothetical protein
MHLNSNISDDPVTWYVFGMPTSQMWVYTITATATCAVQKLVLQGVAMANQDTQFKLWQNIKRCISDIIITGPGIYHHKNWMNKWRTI